MCPIPRVSQNRCAPSQSPSDLHSKDAQYRISNEVQLPEEQISRTV
jgi:hypothetical protein